jgi:hypothetical protein
VSIGEIEKDSNWETEQARRSQSSDLGDRGGRLGNRATD